MSVQEEMLLDTFLIKGTSYWLGLSDLAHEGTMIPQSIHPFKRIDDLINFAGTYRWQESHQVAEYVNWAPGEPGESTVTNCIWKSYNPNVPGWHDALCSLSSAGGHGQIHALCQTPP